MLSDNLFWHLLSVTGERHFYSEDGADGGPWAGRSLRVRHNKIPWSLSTAIQEHPQHQAQREGRGKMGISSKRYRGAMVNEYPLSTSSFKTVLPNSATVGEQWHHQSPLLTPSFALTGSSLLRRYVSAHSTPTPRLTRNLQLDPGMQDSDTNLVTLQSIHQSNQALLEAKSNGRKREKQLSN